MSYSKFATHCPKCETIKEPTFKDRQPDGLVKATFRCDCQNTWQQNFNVSHEAPQIEPPEQQEQEDEPYQPPEIPVSQWDEQQRDEYIEANSRQAYSKLVGKSTKQGEAYAEQSKPDMPQKDNPKLWTDAQRNNFIDEWGREKYNQRMQYQIKKEKGLLDN